MASQLFWATYALLWGTVLVVLTAMVLVYRHLGSRLVMQRMRDSESGPQVGTEAPTIELRDEYDRVVSIGGQRARPQAVFVVSPTCPGCTAIRTAIVAFAQTREDLDVVVVCAADLTGFKIYASVFDGPVQVIQDEARLVHRGLRINQVPFLIGLDTEGRVRAKGVAGSLAAIEHACAALVSEELTRVISRRRPVDDDVTAAIGA